MSKKIMFTGGHHNSAVAVIDWLQQNSDVSCMWVGKKYVPQSKDLLPEYKEVTRRKIPYYHLQTGKLFRATSIRYIPQIIWNLVLIPIGFVNSFYILLKHRPDLIVSFGGFIAVPIVITARILGIESVTHEQTSVLGLANSIITKFVKKIYISWPLNYYGMSDSIKKKCIYTGLPLRKEVLEAIENRKKEMAPVYFENDKPTLYITGGKAGANYINTRVLEILSELVEKANIIWQCGPEKSGLSYDEILSYIIKDIPNGLSKNVILKEYVGESEIKNVFTSSDIVISRGGAHIIYELAALSMPSIIIPIPWSSNNEQYENAKILHDMGLAEILNQENMTSKDLLNTITKIINSMSSYVIDDSYTLELHGQEKLGNEILTFIKKS